MNPSGQNEQKPLNTNQTPIIAHSIQSSLNVSQSLSPSPSPMVTLQKSSLSPQSNSINLSKALAKPPPLSSILTLPKNALLNTTPGLMANGIGVGGATNSNSSSLSPSPSPFSLSLTSSNRPPEAAPITTNNTNTTTTNPNLSLSASSIFKTSQETSAHHQAFNTTFSNSMPASTTAQLFQQTNVNTSMTTPNQATTASPLLAQQINSSQNSLNQFSNSNGSMLNRTTAPTAAITQQK